ncbi:MAG: hypothetical protein LBL35_03970 [Clostridiales bacterium]|jgi:YbbR domain-containing protein|nr:hypothetical protein [Clostridiales bacterium]
MMKISLKSVTSVLTRNIAWKALSLLTALTLWLLVMNIYNPIQAHSISVPLQLENIQSIQNNDYILQNETALRSYIVTLSVRASDKSWAELRKNQPDIRAYIDFAPIDISRTVALDTPLSVRVKYELPSLVNAGDYEIRSVNPSEVNIILDKYVEREFPIKVQKIGVDAEGYISMPAVVAPDTALVRGAKKNIDSISSVQVNVDISGVTEKVSVEGDIRVINDSGADITGEVELSAEKALISADVQKYSRVEIAAPPVSGVPAEGYMFVSVEWEPKFVEVVGAEEDVDALSLIRLPQQNIDNQSESYEISMDLRERLMDTNVSIRNGATNEVKIKINIGVETQASISIPMSNVSVEGTASLSVILPERNVELIVKGLASAVEALTEEMTRGVVNASGLEPGAYELPIAFPDMPQSVAVVSDEPVITVILEKKADDITEPENREVAGADSGESLDANESGAASPPTSETPLEDSPDTPSEETANVAGEEFAVGTGVNEG